MEELTGRVFGPYRIVAPLGEGGMASVYKAYQPSVDRYVALKILPSRLVQDPEFLGRFRQEAKVLASLQHPHILPVHDFGESDGFTYIVMPFVSAGTLAALLHGQPLPLDEIRRVMSQVGDALDCAHARGLVHRDVKPSNILMDERGNCLLADFGIAKILEGTQKFTRTGGIVGTPAYMSPEQGLGNPLDGRSDVYSLGVVLYEMATGRPPFKAETPMAIVIKHINDPLPLPRSVNPQLPEAVERVILKALHKRPADRYATAGEMSAALSSTFPLPGVPSDIVETIALPSSGGTQATTIRREEPTTVPSESAAAGAGPPPPAEVVDPAAGRDDIGSRPSIAASEGADTGSAQSARSRSAVAIAAALVMLAVFLFWRWDAPGPTVSDQIADLQGPASTVAPEDPAAEESVAGEARPARDEAADAVPAAPPITGGEPSIPVDAPSPVDSEPVGTLRPGEPARVAAEAPALQEEDARRQAEAAEAAAFVEEERRLFEAEIAARDPFPDGGDGTFLDRLTGFRWTVESQPRSGGSGWLWTEASSSCEALSLAGSSDWHLPSQEELDLVLRRLDLGRYAWGCCTLWSSSRPFGVADRLWVTLPSSPLLPPQWSNEVRDISGRRFTHRAVCVDGASR